MNVATDYLKSYYHSMERIMRDGKVGGLMFDRTEKAAPEAISYLKGKIRLLHG